MRWLPYPTRRSPHRRFIACLVACSYLLQPVVYAVDIGALEESPKTTVLKSAKLETTKQAGRAAEESHSEPTTKVTMPKTEGEGNEELCAAMPSNDTFEKDFQSYKENIDLKLKSIESVYRRVYQHHRLLNYQENHLTFYQNGDSSLIGSVKEICLIKANLEQQTKSANLLLAKARNEKKPDACASSINSVQTTLDSALYTNNEYKNKIKKRLEHLRKLFNRSYTNSSDDAHNWQNAVKLEAPDHVIVLRKAFTLLWGNPWDAKENDEKTLRAGLFSSILQKIKQEGEGTVKREKDLVASKAEAGKNLCGSLASARDVKTIVNSTDGKVDPSCTGGNEFTNPGCKRSGSGSYCEVRNECLGKTSSDIGTRQGGETLDGPPVNTTGDDRRQTPALSTNGEQPTTTNQPKDSSSWMPSGSTMLMVGGGVAAVAGGVILYKKNQDDKAKAKAHAEELEAIALANVTEQQNQSATATTTSTSTSTSTDSTVGATPTTQQASHGSTLSINGVPAQAKVGSNIGTVTIKILGPNNVMTQNSDTDVTISCDSPSPCTLTGQLTVNTDLGEAQFSNVQFTGPHKNVRLKFSAPGFADAISAAEFDVIR